MASILYEPPAPTEILHLDLKTVRIPEGRKRKPLSLKDEKDQHFIQSIERSGILQPIEVRQAGDRYEIVFGIRRYLAAKHLGLPTIPCKVGDWNDIQAAFVATTENTMRRLMDHAEYLKHLKVMMRELEALFGPDPGRAVSARATNRKLGKRRKDSEGKFQETGPKLSPSEDENHASPPRGFAWDEDDGVARNDEDESAPKAHSTIIREATGTTRSVTFENIAMARAFTDDQLAVLQSLQMTRADIERIARLEPAEARNMAIDNIEAGNPVEQAVIAATAQFKATQKFTTTGKPARIPEIELSDAQWLEVYCGDLRRNLQDPRFFDRDALLYRRTREDRQSFKMRTRNAVGEAMDMGWSPFAGLLNKLIRIEHPGDWWLCHECMGQNIDYKQNNKGEDCEKCWGRGYLLRTMDKKKT